jgi:uncharacterized protein YndB with AHSA1/START domain
MSEQALGGLGRDTGGRCTLRFERTLPHPPERVWRALTEPEHLAAWFPSEIRGERRAGARLDFVFEHDPDHPIAGEVLVFEPPRALAYRWGDDVLRFDLDDTGDGGTLLRFLNTFDELGKAARDAAGWHVCLDALGRHLAGEPPVADPRVRWEEVEERYIASFGPEAATIGPPQD